MKIEIKLFTKFQFYGIIKKGECLLIYDEVVKMNNNTKRKVTLIALIVLVLFAVSFAIGTMISYDCLDIRGL